MFTKLMFVEIHALTYSSNTRKFPVHPLTIEEYHLTSQFIDITRYKEMKNWVQKSKVIKPKNRYNPLIGPEIFEFLFV
jgi:hypothetical protein